MEDDGTFMLQLREELVYVQEKEGKKLYTTRNERYSVKKITKVRDEHYAHFQNKLESLKRMVNVEEKHHAEL